MIKTEPSSTQRTEIGCLTNYDSYSGTTYQWVRENIRNGENTISYAEGRRLPSGHWPWKECTHERDARWKSPYVARVEWSRERRYSNGRVLSAAFYQNLYRNVTIPALPKGGWDRNCCKGILDQIDLNKGESVLLYSGVLQAVPLLTGVLKLNRTLKEAARKFKKDLRKKPFTTAVKTLISADFIDRFVISPTLDDARRFQDATDYVLRVIQTAQERTSHVFALDSELITRDYKEEGTSWFSNGNVGTINTRTEMRYRTSSKAFALVEARYDIGGIEPIKLWARRVGLTRPLDSVWDLVPFSFVVDYFTRAGDFISYLSDKMSDVEGLRGKILKIHDLWGTYSSSNTYTERMTSYAAPSLPKYYHWTQEPTCSGDGSVCETSLFRRFRVGDPWGLLSSLYDKPSDYLTVNTTLSSTRKRTIAELIIQAKL